MKFGLEIEKFLFDLKHSRPSDGVFRFIDALTDLELYGDSDPIKHVTNEFVLNLIEITTEASVSPKEVFKGYLQNYLLLKSVALRESVTLVPMGSMPMDFQPHMIPKWSYFVQNSILDKKIQSSWTMNKESPLTPAGNCAGMHVHTEIETSPEYLFSNTELVDKFNLALMLTPLIALASSPYFFGKHEAVSMRGQRYFEGVYKEHPMNGGLPPVMHSSEEVLLYFEKSSTDWLKRGIEVGLPAEDLKRLISKKAANWNPVRWNRQWNTIELRCLDSDRIDLEASKFFLVCGVMKRSDKKGEGLVPKPLKGGSSLNVHLIDQCFKVDNKEVNILPTEAIKALFARAITFGIHDELVKRYIYRLIEFSRPGISPETSSILQIVIDLLNTGDTTSEIILKKCDRATQISQQKAVEIVNSTVSNEQLILGPFCKLLDYH